MATLDEWGTLSIVPLQLFLECVLSDPVFTPDDDGFHFANAGDEWWATETAWYSFHNVERKLGGWFYSMFRPNIGTVAGGAWIWDDTAHLPWEVLYSTNYSALQIPEGSDLRDIELPTGVSIRVETPMLAYHLGYNDPDRLVADLRFEAVAPPRPLAAGGSTFGKAAHFDQIGRVTGTLDILGERVDIDCWSMRDRTWGKRPENRPRQAGYVTGAGDGGTGFLAVTNTRDGADRIAYGFVDRGAGQVSMTDGERQVIRDPNNGWVDQVIIDGVDAEGSAFRAVGESVSRITINRHSFIDINSLMHWRLEGSDAGTEWWGEDQDMWPVHTWAETKRAGAFNE